MGQDKKSTYILEEQQYLIKGDAQGGQMLGTIGERSHDDSTFFDNGRKPEMSLVESVT